MQAVTQNGALPMYDDIAILKDYTTTSRDKYGNAIKTLVTSQIYVQPRGVYSSEFYNAAQRDGISLICEERAGNNQ